MSETYVLNTVPSPKDVINHPVSLFINSVLNQDTVLEHVTEQNCTSYIAAIAKEVKGNLSSLTTEDIDRIAKASDSLIKVLAAKQIALKPIPMCLIANCSLIYRPEFQAQFNIVYELFVESLQED